MAQKLSIIIENISKGKQKGFMATLPELENSIVFGGNLAELMDGIGSTLEIAQKHKIGIFKDSAVSAENKKKTPVLSK